MKILLLQDFRIDQLSFFNILLHMVVAALLKLVMPSFYSGNLPYTLGNLGTVPNLEILVRANSVI